MRVCVCHHISLALALPLAFWVSDTCAAAQSSQSSTPVKAVPWGGAAACHRQLAYLHQSSNGAYYARKLQQF